MKPNNISTVLQELLLKNNLNASRLSKKTGVSRATIGRILKSEVVPNDNTLESLSNYFNITRDYLLTGNETLGKQNLKKVFQDNKENTPYYTNKNGNEFEELPTGKFLIKAPHVPFKAYASFIEVYGDEYQTNEAFEERYYSVDHIGKGKYISFSVKNDSMNGGGINDTPSGADVLAREVQKHHWRDGFRFCDYGFIVVSKNGIFHKDITNMDEDGNIICHSRNDSPEFPDFQINLNEVHSIYKVIKRNF